MFDSVDATPLRIKCRDDVVDALREDGTAVARRIKNNGSKTTFASPTQGLTDVNACAVSQHRVHVTHYLEEAFEHDVDDLILLVDVIQLNQILQRVELISSLCLKQTLIW